ncbi:MAG TPA: c-type cytochrome [Methylomirabilota bacterium]|nr:c-type cytochrome [Methylomirabilota bacterium]
MTRILALLVALVAASSAGAAAADVEAGRRKAEACAGCHGLEGHGTMPGTPSLAGQPAYFTHWQLIKYRDGRRQDPQMSPFAKNLTDEDMGDLAAFYANQAPRGRGSEVDATRAEVGRSLVGTFHCSSCHTPKLTGQQQVPLLAGQDLTYLLKLLRGFKARTASDLDGTMTMAAQPLTAEDVENLAHYLASLDPAAR